MQNSMQQNINRSFLTFSPCRKKLVLYSAWVSSDMTQAYALLPFLPPSTEVDRDLFPPGSQLRLMRPREGLWLVLAPSTGEDTEPCLMGKVEVRLVACAGD